MVDIKIDVTDWADEYKKEEPGIKGKADLVEARQKYHAADVAKFALVARERKDAEPGILRPNKLILLTGAVHEIGQYISKLRRLVQVGENGHEIEVPGYIAPVKNGDDDDFSGGPIISTETKQASKYARRYLRKQVLPRFRQRLAILAGNGENVREIAQEFVDEVWAIVETLE